MNTHKKWWWSGRMQALSVWIFVLVVSTLLSAVPVMAQGGGDGEPAATPFYTMNDDPALNARMDFVEQATSILRDLPPLEPVTRAFLTRGELIGYVEQMLDEEYPPERARDDAIFYHAFDFMPLDTDLRQIQLDVLAEQIAGFYDPEIEAMFVISSQAELSAMNQILYAHEFTHVLQDQYYDLEAIGLDEDFQAEQPDTALAALALIEGDAMLMTEGYQTWMMNQNPGMVFDMLGDALLVETEALLSAPDILRTELMFPYTVGRDFAYALFAESGGWAGVNAAYSNLPQTTEQVLHPERYASAEPALAVTVAPLDDVLGEGWREVWNRTLGEFYLREMLRQSLDRAMASTAAAGWGGDQYRLYADDAAGTSVLAWQVAWDTPEDAAEFAAAFTSYAAQLYDEPGFPLDESTLCWYGEDVRCLRTGSGDTLVIRVPDRDIAAAVLAEIGSLH